MVGSSVLLAVVAFAGYNAFLLTESVSFCGNTCHTQMGPEMTAYKTRPCARVACVACHVGEGAGHYLHSKLAGSPSSGPSRSTLRPADPGPREGAASRARDLREVPLAAEVLGLDALPAPPLPLQRGQYARADHAARQDGRREGAFDSGIHWHMVVQNEIQYVAEDAQLQRSLGPHPAPDGSTTEYFRTEKPIDPARWRA